MWAAKYPDLVELYSVGQSFEGREIWQITITNKKTGKDTDKPAFFLEGGRHAGEISGIETALYFINHVLTSYGTDPAITKLVDTKALYCKPQQQPGRRHAVSPDGPDRCAAPSGRTTTTATACSMRTPARTSTATASSGRCASSSGPARATRSRTRRTRRAGR